MAGADLVDLILSSIPILPNEVVQLILNAFNVAKQER
jgi:hypothetical protein